MTRLALPIVIALTAMALPAGASAETFCAPSPCSEGTAHPTIQGAIDAADADPGDDVVAIAPGTHIAPVAGLSVGQSDTEVRGAGIGQTIVTGDPLTAVNLSYTLISGQMARLSDLTLRLPTAVNDTNSIATGAVLANGTVERVRVDAVGAEFGPGVNDGQGHGLEVRNGAIRDVVVDLGLDQDVQGIRVGGFGPPGVDLENVEVTARDGALTSDPVADPSPATVTAKRVVLRSHRPVVVSDGFLELSDAVLDASSAPRASGAEIEAVGVRVFDSRSDPVGVTMDRVTLLGNGDPLSFAFGVAGQGSDPPAFLRARHVLNSGFGRTLAHQNFGSVPQFTIDYSNVDTGPAAIVDGGPPGGGPPGATLGPGNVAGDPLLRNPLAGDFSLRPGSPAIDIGGPHLLPAGPADLGGGLRPVDGDGNGTALIDAGAFEARYAADGAEALIGGRRVKLNKRGVGAIPVTCPPPAQQPSPCTVSLTLATQGSVKFKGASRRVELARSRPVEIAGGETARVPFAIKGAKRRLVWASRKARRVRGTVAVTDRYGETGTAAKRLKLKPKLR